MSRPVLLTRPAGQIAQTAAVLRAHGLSVLEMPLTRIVPPARRPAARDLAFARQADWLIFTSRNAVQHAAGWLSPDGGQQVAAIGRATADAAREQGWRVSWSPQGSSSETLLDEAGAPRLSGRVCLVAGSGGRRWLKTALQRRGCTVRKLIVYRRGGIDHGRDAMLAVLRQRPRLVFSSGHALRQWAALSRCRRLPQALDLPLLVASRRLCKLARSLGYTQPAQALPQMSDAALLNALTEHSNDARQERPGRSARGSGSGGAGH